MTPMLLAAVALVSFAEPPAPPTGRPADDKQLMTALDGSWTVLCYEKDGQPVPEAKRMTVTVKDNVATFTGTADDSKHKAMKFAFGPQATIRVNEIDANASTAPTDDKKAASGVYVMTKDYLAICLHDTAATGDRTDKDRDATAGGQASTKSKCTVILQRSGTGDRR